MHTHIYIYKYQLTSHLNFKIEISFEYQAKECLHYYTQSSLEDQKLKSVCHSLDVIFVIVSTKCKFMAYD